MIISKLIEVIFMFMLGMKEAFLSNNVELIGIIQCVVKPLASAMGI